MRRYPDVSPADLRAHMVDPRRTGPAHAALALGVAGNASVLPPIAWGLVIRGFR